MVVREPTQRLQHLPAQVTLLIGREKEIADVARRLLTPSVRLLTLTGPGGIGKTCLALAVAKKVQDEFADGVFLVSLAPIRDPNLVVPTIAQTLGLREEGVKPLADVLQDYVHDKKMLLVLDNFEQVIAAAPLVAGLLAASHELKILITSREVLRLRGEFRFVVPPLALCDPKGLHALEEARRSDAVRLFVARAQEVSADFALTDENAQAVVEICCRRLEGLPLAIELAAARVALLTPQDILERMDHRRLRVLTGGARDLPERQQTMRKAIAWSYDLLDDIEKKLFQRLSVFTGGFTLEAAEMVCDANGDLGIEVLDGLESLLGKSLLQCETTGNQRRFTMLETIREYAQECLDASGETAKLRQIHASFYFDLATRAASEIPGPREVEWLDRLDREHDNLREALAWTVENGQKELGLRLAVTLGHFWHIRGEYTEGRRWLEQMLADSTGLDGALRAQGFVTAGRLAWGQGDLDACYLVSGQALAIARERLAKGVGLADQNKQIIAAALFNMSMAAIFRADWATERLLAEEYLALSRELQSRVGLAVAAWFRATSALEQGDYTLARSLQEEGLATAQDLGNKDAISLQFFGLGNLALVQGDYAGARSFFERKMAIDRERGDKRGMAIGLRNLALAAYAQGDLSAAQASAEESLLILRRLGDRFTISGVLGVFAALAVTAGQVERAAWLLGYAEWLDETLGVSEVLPYLRPFVERTNREVRARLDPETLAQIRAEARTASLDQAIDYALATATGRSSPSETDSMILAAPNAPAPGLPPESPGATAKEAGPALADTGGLTPREREIASLVAQGLTNREIGAKLVISDRTVQTHLTNIMAKLNLTSRTQVGVWVTKHLTAPSGPES